MSYKDIEETALKLASNFHVLKLLQEYHDHTDDPWLRLVMKRALKIVCENKLFKDYTIEIEEEFEDRELGTALAYDMAKSGRRSDDYTGGNIFPFDTQTLVTDGGTAYKIQGSQFPDYIVILNARHSNGTEKRFAMVFEGEANKKDAGKKKSGMFLYEKMFQDAAFCQDIQPGVSAIFIALAMRACEKEQTRGKNQTFPQWTEALLQSCVLMATRLVMYILNISPDKDFIGEELGKIDKRDRTARQYDLYCWINVTHGDRNNLLKIDARTCFEEFSSSEILQDDGVDVDSVQNEQKKDHKDEFIQLLKYNKVVTGEWPTPNESSEHTFYTKKIVFHHKKTPVTILAVERATRSVERNKDVDAAASIDQIETRVKRLDKRIADIDGEIAVGGLTQAEEDDLEERKEYIEDELERLQKAIDELNARGQVTLSRGMWYPNNVREVLGPRRSNRTISNLRPMCNFMSLYPGTIRLDFEDFGKKRVDTILTDSENLVPHQGHICITLPWLWTNIGFLYMLNKKVNYEWTKSGNLVALAQKFKRNRNQNWRGGVGGEVEVQMFPRNSKTLFARLCKAMSVPTATVKLDDQFKEFLFETCGWKDCDESNSPAMFFRLLGVSNVKTGALISSAMAKNSNPRFENIKKSFPLNAQVEIDFAVAALAAMIYHTTP